MTTRNVGESAITYINWERETATLSIITSLQIRAKLKGARDRRRHSKFITYVICDTEKLKEEKNKGNEEREIIVEQFKLCSAFIWGRGHPTTAMHTII